MSKLVTVTVSNASQYSDEELINKALEIGTDEEGASIPETAEVSSVFVDENDVASVLFRVDL